ncbi:MAG: nucleotidyltransferase domain-containing protein [Deltaproteobacteria bacterium]|nr:MAG: nucleotidyltransferase domain-containing protein [Deltaproteobacteria bacterium]
MDLSAKRREYVRRLEEAVDRLKRELASIPEVERVILFGSYVRGRRDLLTDLDVLVVMRTDLKPLERLRWLYRKLSLPVDVDLLCLTPEELEQRRHASFFQGVLREGEVIYEKEPC